MSDQRPSRVDSGRMARSDSALRLTSADVDLLRNERQPTQRAVGVRGKFVPLTDAHEERPWATPRYLRRLVERREISFYRIARRIWFDVADLDEFAERRHVRPVRNV